MYYICMYVCMYVHTRPFLVTIVNSRVHNFPTMQKAITGYGTTTHSCFRATTGIVRRVQAKINHGHSHNHIITVRF